MTIGAKVIIHKPPFRFLATQKEVINQKKQEINDRLGSTRDGNLPELRDLLDEKNPSFYTFEHLLLIFDYKLRLRKKDKLLAAGVPTSDINVDTLQPDKFNDTDLDYLKQIFSTLEKAADKFSEDEADYLFLHYIDFRDPKSILVFLQDYPKFMGRLSSARLSYFATFYGTSEVAEYLLNDLQYSRILSQDNYSRHKIYNTYPDNLFLADQAASVFDIKRIYRHDINEQNEDRRDIPDNFKKINDKHSKKEKLISDINQLQQDIIQADQNIKNWENLLSATRRNDDAELTSFKKLLRIEESPVISPQYVNLQINNVKITLKDKKLKLKQKKDELENLRTEIIALANKEEFVIGKRALDIFLRKQATDKEKEQSHANMRTLIKLTPKYRSLVDERHVEAMFALAKTEGEFIAVLHYLTRNNSTKTYLINCLELLLDPTKNQDNFSLIQIAAKKNIWQYIESGSLLRVESTSYLKFYVKHPDVMKAIFQNAPDKFADSLIERLTADSETSAINISERYVRELLKANAYWLTAEHLIELNKKIINNERNGNHNRKVIWHNYLKKHGLEKLRTYIKNTINDPTHNTVSGVKNTKLANLLDTIKNYPDFRGWLAIGNIDKGLVNNEKGLVNNWISCTNQEPELCRLVALDSHLFKSYSENTPQALNNVYLEARRKFEYNIVKHRGFFSDFLDSVKNTVKSIVNVSSTYEKFIANQSGINEWSQETAFILAELHWNSIQPIRRANESIEDFGVRKKAFCQQSPFFEAKMTNKRLIEIVMSQLSTKETRLEALRMLSKSELLFAETLRSAINGEDELIELADIIRRIPVSGDSHGAEKDKDEDDKEKLLKVLDNKLVAGLLNSLEKDAKVPSEKVQKLAGAILEKIENPVQLIQLGKKYEKLTDFKKNIDKALLSKLQAYSKIAIKDESNALNTEDNASYLMSILPQASLQQLMKIETTVKKIYDEETAEKIRQEIQKTMIQKLVDKEKLDSNDSPTGAVKLNPKKSEKKKVKVIDLSLDKGSGVSASDEDQKKNQKKLMKASSSESRSESETESCQENTESTTYSTSSTSTTSEKSEIEIDGTQAPQSVNKNTELLTYIKTALLTDKNCTLEQLKTIYLNYEELREHIKTIIVKKLLQENDLGKVRDFILSFKPEVQAILSDIFKDNKDLSKKIFDSLADGYFPEEPKDSGEGKYEDKLLLLEKFLLSLGQFLQANSSVLTGFYDCFDNAKNFEAIEQHTRLILFLSNTQNFAVIQKGIVNAACPIYLKLELLKNADRIKDLAVIVFNDDIDRYNPIANAFIPNIVEESLKAEFVIYMLNSGIANEKDKSDYVNEKFFLNENIKKVLKIIFSDLNCLNKIDENILNEIANISSARVEFGSATNGIQFNKIREQYPQFGHKPIAILQQAENSSILPEAKSPSPTKKSYKPNSKKSERSGSGQSSFSVAMEKLASSSQTGLAPEAGSSEPQAGGSGSVLDTARAESGVASSSSSPSPKTHLTTAGTFQERSAKRAETRSKNARKLEESRTRSASQ